MGFQVLLVGRVGPSALSLHLNRTEEEIQEKGFGISEHPAGASVWACAHLRRHMKGGDSPAVRVLTVTEPQRNLLAISVADHPGVYQD